MALNVRTRLVILALSSVLWAPLLVAGCGYGFQGSRNEFWEQEGIHKVYVKPLVNDTYKPGVENVMYNALVRTLLAHRRVALVRSEAEADAVLAGTVFVAQFVTSGATRADSLVPLGLALPPGKVNIRYGGGVTPLDSIQVASVYTAALTCDFVLVRRNPPPGKPAKVWNGGFSRSKPFPASNQLDVPGATSALINESEFERALGEIAVSMADDVHESMLDMF